MMKNTEVIEMGFEYEMKELRKALEEWAYSAQPGDFRFFNGWEIMFLPPDWEKYYRYGCDSDGGNYCSYVVPLGWKNPVTMKPEFYLAEYSSCELGGNVYVIMTERGNLCVVKESEMVDGDWEREVYMPWHPDMNLRGPMSVDELVREWMEYRKSEIEEQEAYEEWASQNN